MGVESEIDNVATGDGNPVAAQSGRTVTDVVTSDLVFRLTRGVQGSGRTVSCTPMTGEIVAELPESTPHGVEVAFSRAREAQREWASLSVRRRAAVLLRFHDILLDKQAEAMDLIQVETGKARLHAHEEVQGVAVVARHYGRKAPAYLRPRRHLGASLELGGKNALLVLADADLDKAVEGAVRTCFSSAGQWCLSAERIFVHSSVAAAFLERFVRRTRALTLGTSLSYGVGMGSLAGRRQLEAVSRHVDQAVAEGATVLAGESRALISAPFSMSPPSWAAWSPRWPSMRRKPSGRSFRCTASPTKTRRSSE